MSNSGVSSNPGGGPRISYGAVMGTGAGDNIAGSGDWTVNNTSTGIYVITFTKPFNTVPVISVDMDASQVEVTNTAYNAYVMSGSITVNGFTVMTAKAVALNAVAGFHFTAVGT